jgi:hypothetical protein
MIFQEILDATVDAGGDYDSNTEALTGELVDVTYVPDGTSPLDTGADIVVTVAESGRAILTKANLGTAVISFAPRQPTHAVADGAALLYAAAGVAVNDRIALANERIRLVISNGGVSLSGQFIFTVKS